MKVQLNYVENKAVQRNKAKQNINGETNEKSIYYGQDDPKFLVGTERHVFLHIKLCLNWFLIYYVKYFLLPWQNCFLL